MAGDGVRRVAVLGGGMGALAAAFELSATEALREQYEVTVYQMGWRLGGKCASARNESQSLRSEEHGLHIWFGFYQNAFGMLREAYEALARPSSHPFHAVEGVFRERPLTSFGSLADDGGPWTFHAPATAGNPWDDPTPDPFDAIARLASWIADQLERWSTERAQIACHAALPRVCCAPELIVRLRAAAADLRKGLDQGLYESLECLVTELRAGCQATLCAGAGEHPELAKLWVMIDLGLAMLTGILDPADAVLPNNDLCRIDRWDFREWLQRHGAWAVNVWAPPVRALYDAAFAYVDGDPMRPSFAAGVAMRVVLRIVLAHRGSTYYLPNAGFGEVVVQPLYEVLGARGVKFKFFHRVERVEAAEGGSRVDRIVLTRQAELSVLEYKPLISIEIKERETVCFEAWPAHPLWEQLVDGARMRDAGVNFESRWCTWPGREVVIERAKDFDDVVFGIPLHAAREVLAGFKDHTTLGPALRSVTAVPTIALQAWLDVPLKRLGWDEPVGLVGGPQPHDIWTDMTQVLPYEPWQKDRKPLSLQYFCAVAPLSGVYAPPTETGVHERATAYAYSAAQRYLADASWATWPGLGPRGTPFPWEILHDDAGAKGADRLKAQYVRANVDPTECCPTSRPGTISMRPTAGGTGVVNMVIAGETARTGVDTSCVESAVMAGRQAARALTGATYEVPGERFLAKLPPDPPRPHAPVPVKPPAPARPAYQSWRGLGEVSIPTPVVFDGCTGWVFLLPGTRTRLQALVDRLLNGPSQCALDVQVVSGCVLLSYLYGAKGFCASEVIGQVPDHEMSLSILIEYKGADGARKLGVFMPYVAVDTAIAMASGRELWGFPKEVGGVTTPTAPRLDCETKALYFTTFSNDTVGAFGPIITITDARPTDAVETPLGDAEGFFKALREQLEKAEPGRTSNGLLPEGRDFDGEKLVMQAHLPVLNLKQFRDDNDSTVACYQALVETSFALSNVQLPRIAFGPVNCTFTQADSHDFVNLLGFAGQSLPLLCALTTSFDFTASGGTVLWRAPG